MAQGDLQDYERLGKAKLSLVDVVAQSVGAMGPVFSMAFLIPLLVGVVSPTGKGAGVAAPLAVLLASIGVFGLGWIVAAYAKRIHAAGSLYDYVTNGLGRTIGAAAGWLYYGAEVLLTCGLGVLIGGYIHDTLVAEFDIEPLPIWAWSVLWAIGLFLVLFLGVRISTRVQLTLAFVSSVVVLAFFVYVIIQVGADNDLGRAFSPSSSPDGLAGVLFGVLYGVLVFVGFETAANLAEETAEPKREIPRGVLLSVLIVTIFYLIASYAQVAGFGFSIETIASAAAAPLFALGSPESAGGYGSVAFVRILELVVLLDILAVGVGTAVAATRGVFAMARDRRLPAPLATVSSRFGTPLGSLVLLMVVQAAFILATEFWDDLFALPETPHYFSIFVWGATFGGFALLVVYALMCLGSFRGFAGMPGVVGVFVASIVGLVITVGGIFGSTYQVPSPTILAPVYALVWFAIGIVVMVVNSGRQPASTVLPDLATAEESGVAPPPVD